MVPRAIPNFLARAFGPARQPALTRAGRGMETVAFRVESPRAQA
jgi:hypothetical protein